VKLEKGCKTMHDIVPMARWFKARRFMLPNRL